MQNNIDLIWRQISTVDSIGRATLIDKCGGDRLSDLLSGARNLAKLLTAVRRALDSASGTLECERINPIYVEAAHNALCTDVASGTSFGFTLFLVLAVCTMAMITLRASWLRVIVEEKVYHDESEVAENMILDEHEEYLAYISKYKHEWQEYRGIDSSSLGRRSGEESFYEEDGSEGSIYFEDGSGRPCFSRFGDDGSKTDGEGYNGSDECSTGEVPASGKWVVGLDTEVIPRSLARGPSIEDGAKCGVSVTTDDISFPSLPVNQSDESSIDEDELFLFPSLLHPPAANPDYGNDTRDFKPSAKQRSAPENVPVGDVESARGRGTPDDRYDAPSAGDIHKAKRKRSKSRSSSASGIEVVLAAENNRSDDDRAASAKETGVLDETAPESARTQRSRLKRAQSAPKPTTPRMNRAHIKLLAKSFDRSRSRSRSNRSTGSAGD